jgi:hypothetical protein
MGKGWNVKRLIDLPPIGVIVWRESIEDTTDHPQLVHIGLQFPQHQTPLILLSCRKQQKTHVLCSAVIMSANLFLSSFPYCKWSVFYALMGEKYFRILNFTSLPLNNSCWMWLWDPSVQRYIRIRYKLFSVIFSTRPLAFPKTFPRCDNNVIVVTKPLFTWKEGFSHLSIYDPFRQSPRLPFPPSLRQFQCCFFKRSLISSLVTPPCPIWLIIGQHCFH